MPKGSHMTEFNQYKKRCIETGAEPLGRTEYFQKRREQKLKEITEPKAEVQ